MTTNQICPIMSRPKNVTALGKVLMYNSISEMKAAGLFIAQDGSSWSGVFYCQREGCMSYVDGRCKLQEKV